MFIYLLIFKMMQALFLDAVESYAYVLWNLLEKIMEMTQICAKHVTSYLVIKWMRFQFIGLIF